MPAAVPLNLDRARRRRGARAAVDPRPAAAGEDLDVSIGFLLDGCDAARYFKTVRAVHPDKGGSAELFQRVKDAHDVLIAAAT